MRIILLIKLLVLIYSTDVFARDDLTGKALSCFICDDRTDNIDEHSIDPKKCLHDIEDSKIIFKKNKRISYTFLNNSIWQPQSYFIEFISEYRAQVSYVSGHYNHLDKVVSELEKGRNNFKHYFFKKNIKAQDKDKSCTYKTSTTKVSIDCGGFNSLVVSRKSLILGGGSLFQCNLIDDKDNNKLYMDGKKFIFSKIGKTYYNKHKKQATEFNKIIENYWDSLDNENKF